MRDTEHHNFKNSNENEVKNEDIKNNVQYTEHNVSIAEIKSLSQCYSGMLQEKKKINSKVYDNAFCRITYIFKFR